MPGHNQRITPYVGVTGFTQPNQANEAFSLLPDYGSPSHYYMAGVLMSSKTLRGQQNSYTRRYPPREHVREIFSNKPWALNTIHYSTDNPTELGLELAAIIGMFCHYPERGDCLGAIQLNMAWPDLNMLDWCQRKLFEPHTLHLILQVGSAALDQIGRDPKRLAMRVKEYIPLVDYILIDPSGGKGKPLDVGFTTNCVRAIYDLEPPMNVGIAGGLCGTSLDTVAPLLQEFLT